MNYACVKYKNGIQIYGIWIMEIFECCMHIYIYIFFLYNKKNSILARNYDLDLARLVDINLYFLPHIEMSYIELINP